MSEQRKSPSIDMNTTFKNGKSRAQKYNNWNENPLYKPKNRQEMTKICEI
jgi:hypothetical protein